MVSAESPIGPAQGVDRSADGAAVSPADPRAFVLAGRAVFTLAGRSARYTYRVTRSDPDPAGPYAGRPTYFVAVLTGPNNETDYTYAGILDARTGAVRATRASAVATDAPSMRALVWTLSRLLAGRSIAPAVIYHQGRCGRCGRRLTVPASIASGIGPECASRR